MDPGSSAYREDEGGLHTMKTRDRFSVSTTACPRLPTASPVSIPLPAGALPPAAFNAALRQSIFSVLAIASPKSQLGQIVDDDDAIRKNSN